MRTIAAVVLFVSSSLMQPAFGATNADAACRRYFRAACSEAMGRWLPKVPTEIHSPARSTTVVDEIVDPAGLGPYRFLNQRVIYRGTFFVYGKAGPLQGHAVYDSVRRIALYDEGCRSQHHVVVASNVPSPPKNVVTRSLAALRTKRGIRLGDAPAVVFAVYGPAQAQAVSEQQMKRSCRTVASNRGRPIQRVPFR